MLKRLLVVQTAFIGDAVLTLPMIEKLHEIIPDSIIDVVAIKSTKEIFECSPFVNEIFIFDKRGIHKSLKGIYSFAKKLKSKGYDAIYSPHRSARTSILVWLTGVKETYGFDTASLSFIYKKKIEYKKDYHEVRRLLEIIEYPTDENNWKIIPKIKLNENAKKKADSVITGKGDKFVAIAPGSVWETKKYPIENFIKVAQMLVEKGFHILLIGGIDDVTLCSAIENEIKGNCTCLAGKMSLIESVFLLKECKLVISNDSAPTHLALLADTPVLTIYCSTIPEFGFYPYNSGSMYLNDTSMPCKPCGIHGRKVCPIKTFVCAYKIAPSMVLDSALRIIK